MAGITKGSEGKPTGEKAVISPVVLKDVEVVKSVVEVEVPKYIEKEYEYPVLKHVPTTKYITQEESTIKYVPTEKPTVFYTKREEPTIKYIKKEEPYTIEVPVPKEVPYDLPVVNMEKADAIAKETLATVNEAKEVLKETKETLQLLQDTIKAVNKSIPNLIKIPNIVEETVTVEVPKYVEKLVEVWGKIKVRDK